MPVMPFFQEVPVVPLPAAPPAPPGVPQIVVDGRTISAPAEIYQAFQAQRRELTRQLSTLEDQRRSIASRLPRVPIRRVVGGAASIVDVMC